MNEEFTEINENDVPGFPLMKELLDMLPEQGSLSILQMLIDVSTSIQE